MVLKSAKFGNVIVDIAFPRCSFVFSQSSCEVSASLIDVRGVAVGAIDLIHCSLSAHCLPCLPVYSLSAHYVSN